MMNDEHWQKDKHIDLFRTLMSECLHLKIHLNGQGLTVLGFLRVYYVSNTIKEPLLPFQAYIGK